MIEYAILRTEYPRKDGEPKSYIDAWSHTSSREEAEAKLQWLEVDRREELRILAEEEGALGKAATTNSARYYYAESQRAKYALVQREITEWTLVQ